MLNNYWDSKRDKEFDEALEEMWREEQEYRRKQEELNISNPMALYGAI